MIKRMSGYISSLFTFYMCLLGLFTSDINMHFISREYPDII